MPRDTAPRMNVVKLEDKEAKLKEFIAAFLASGAARQHGCADDGALLLVARTLQSPVALAIASLASEGALDRPVRAIITTAAAPEAGSGELKAAVERARDFIDALRIARDQRLLDAHEQLVLGPETSWVGDCMRRDPAKRDAYECYAAACSTTASWTRMSFERLWQVCETIELARPPAKVECEAECAAVSAAGDQPASGSTVPTPH